MKCRVCGDLIRRVEGSPNEWVWIDDSGSSGAIDVDLRTLAPNPWSYLNALSAYDKKGRIEAMSNATGDGTRWEFATDGDFWGPYSQAQEYSMLMTRLDLQGFTHSHYPEVLAVEPVLDHPEHCGWPARLRPGGWSCRECDEPLARQFQQVVVVGEQLELGIPDSVLVGAADA